MPAERLQKVLAAAGVGSRRASEALIVAGRVRVDGRLAVLGESVDPAAAAIEVDGQPIGIGAARAYLAIHKPAGATSTTRDRHARTTVLDLVPTALVPDGTRLYPVGRLDLESEGLLLLTNDGDWADRILHPRHGVQREYAVAVVRPLEPDQVRLLGRGIRLDEGVAVLDAPLRLATASETARLAALLEPPPEQALTWYRATLAQGWKRQLRRMFAAAGSPIVRLVRVRVGTLRLDLPSGAARRLKAPEIRALAGTLEPRPGTGHRAAGGRTRPSSRRPTTTGSGARGHRSPARREDYPRPR